MFTWWSCNDHVMIMYVCYVIYYVMSYDVMWWPHAHLPSGGNTVSHCGPVKFSRHTHLSMSQAPPFWHGGSQTGSTTNTTHHMANTNRLVYGRDGMVNKIRMWKSLYESQNIPVNLFIGESPSFLKLNIPAMTVLWHDTWIKAILRDVMGEEKLTFHSASSYIYVMTLVVTVL